MANYCKFAKAIKEHFEKEGRNLEASLKAAGAQSYEAKQIEKFINNRVKSATGKQKAEIIKKALNPDLSKKEYKEAFNRLIDESHNGSLNEITAKNAIGETMGITGLKAEQRKQITDLAKELQKAPIGSNERKLLSAKLSAAIADVAPRTKSEIAKTLIFTGDLLNPITQIKNVFGNGIYSGWRAINAQAAGALDWAYVGANNLLGGKATRERFVTVLDGEAYKKAVEDLWSGLKEGARDALQGINTSEIVSDTYNQTSRQVFKAKWNPLTHMEKVTKVALSAPDRAFYKMAAGQELLQLQKAAKAANPKFDGVPTSEMLELAHLEGLKATFQDDSLLAQGAKKLKEGLNLNQKFGLGDIAMTYTKTPANILTRAVEMTPLRAVGGAIDLYKHFKGEELIKRGKLTEGLTNATLGTGLIASAASLSSMGIITGQLPAQEEGANRKAQGEQSFAINMSALKRYIMSGGNKEAAKRKPGDINVNYGWAQPVAIPLAIGAKIGEFANKKLSGEKADTLNQLLEAAKVAPNIMIEQSFLKGIYDLFDTQPNDKTSGLQKVAIGAAQRFIPGRSALNTITRLKDNTVRETYDKNPLVQAKNQIQAQIPFASEKLPAKVDVVGQEMKRGSDNLAVRAINTLLNPAQVSKLKGDTEINEVLRIYGETGEKEALFKQADKKIKIKDENGQTVDKELTGREMGKYQTFLGRESKAIIGDALQDTAFNDLTDAEKADVLGKIIKATNLAAKIKLFNHNPELNKRGEIAGNGGRMAEAILSEDVDLVNEELMNLIDKRRQRSAKTEESENEPYIGYYSEGGG